MLRALEIRDILIIDRLDLEVRPGLNVLTGETGAGKSILLDSLGFVLGWRGRADLVRQGAAQGEVTALFELGAGHPAHAILEEAGLPGGEELILRRVNTTEGRKTAWVNDRRVSGEVLRQLSGVLVELHGQHDDRGLLDARGHRALLDAYGQHAPLLETVAGAWADWRAAQRARQGAAQSLERARAEEEFLRHAAEELLALDPQPGEEPELDRRRRLMQAAERVMGDVRSAGRAMAGEDGAEAALSQAARWLEGAVPALEGLADAPLAALDRAMAELAEAQAGVEACLQALSFDPLELETVEERLFALRGLARKHAVVPEDLPSLAADFQARIDAIDGGAGSLARLEEAEAEAEKRYRAAAATLGDARREAAARLDQAVMAELAPLKMERAVFTTEITAAPPGAEGEDAVAFRVATNPGAPSGALEKIASGGELSRFLLALKVCLTTDSHGLTLIFDEIDRGVGGATADAVGRRLAALAEGEAQVLVVTHSPQVAARGGHHWRVEKRVENGITLSTVTPLAPGDRVDEIARMISGDRVTEEARQAAKALLRA
ncbi:DNA repair protein RecN [Mangrovicoccus algicola]|uniref:DNA repair protein RecN n=1 Tax=Mangrovicoccus algicola TaxID=2771008 RepID=A0A8J7CHV8_9RHOB|nr:DNA repair protein RecN [Mangrovicoccus algicola]MBE3638760.1 DNA repair protein RecN [Mangrovicoccus algicola]